MPPKFRIEKKSAAQNILVGGGPMALPCDFLPAGDWRVDELALAADLVLNVPAAGLTSDQQTRIIDTINCERRVDVTALGMNALDWSARGMDATRPAALAVGNNQAVSYYWPLNLRDPRFVEPTDFSGATAFYRGRNVDVKVSDMNALVAGTAIVSGSIYLVAKLSPLAEGQVPRSVVNKQFVLTGKSLDLKFKGELVDVVLVKDDGSDLTDAELGDLTLTVDSNDALYGQGVAFRARDLCRSWNRDHASGAALQGVTDGTEGEALPTNGTQPWLPVWHPGPRPCKSTKLVYVNDLLTFSYTGNLAANAAKLFVRYLEPVSDVVAVKAADKLGWDVSKASIELKTASKNGVSEAASAAIGHRFVRRFRGIFKRAAK